MRITLVRLLRRATTCRRTAAAACRGEETLARRGLVPVAVRDARRLLRREVDGDRTVVVRNRRRRRKRLTARAREPLRRRKHDLRSLFFYGYTGITPASP
jgi:hypothetical protein